MVADERRTDQLRDRRALFRRNHTDRRHAWPRNVQHRPRCGDSSPPAIGKGITPAHIVAVAFTAVAMAEVAGDKTLYTIGSLGTRYSLAPLMAGVFVAFGANALVAVVAGRWIADLPRVA